jgi:hypothetical protein
LQTSNGATASKTLTNNGSATPASRKRTRKSPEKLVGPQKADDDEERPVGKKAKAATPAASGVKCKEVKSEPLANDGQVSETEVNFF